MFPKSVTESKYLLSVTLIPCPEGVTVTEVVCIVNSLCTMVGDRLNTNKGYSFLDTHIQVLGVTNYVFVKQL